MLELSKFAIVLFTRHLNLLFLSCVLSLLAGLITARANYLANG